MTGAGFGVDSPTGDAASAGDGQTPSCAWRTDLLGTEAAPRTSGSVVYRPATYLYVPVLQVEAAGGEGR